MPVRDECKLPTGFCEGVGLKKGGGDEAQASNGRDKENNSNIMKE